MLCVKYAAAEAQCMNMITVKKLSKYGIQERAKMYKYIIKDIPPSNNKFIGRKNIWEYRKIKQEWETLIKYSVMKNKPEKPLAKAEIHIKYFFPDRRRRDPDNYSGKMILDGLRKAGIVADDSFDNIVLVLSAECDRKNPRTEITVKEVNNNVD